MFTTGPPSRGGGDADLDAVPFGVSVVRRRLWEEPAKVWSRPDHGERFRTYVTDLLRPYKMEFREDVVTDRQGHSYGEMAAELVTATVPPEQDVDLLILVFSVPDVKPGRSVATYLSHVCPGTPVGFAVCEQGSAGGFTALRLAREYARAGESRRTLLVIVEQATLPYHPAQPVELPDRHRAVALLCDGGGPAQITPVHQRPGVAPDQVAATLADQVKTLTTGRTDATLVLGGALTPATVAPSLSGLVGQVRSGPAGAPDTGGWWRLADELADPVRPPAGPVLLAGYDPVLRCLSLVGFEPRP